jgi:hypothetical protein
MGNAEALCPIESRARLAILMVPVDTPEVAEDYDANGVDLTLIRACQKESPLECLQMLEEMQQLAESVNRVGDDRVSATPLPRVTAHAA